MEKVPKYGFWGRMKRSLASDQRLDVRHASTLRDFMLLTGLTCQITSFSCRKAQERRGKKELVTAGRVRIRDLSPTVIMLKR